MKQALEDILYSKENCYLYLRGINSLYEQFSEATQVYAGDLTHEHMALTANGKIVTPVQAAHCLNDLGRSTKFYRALHQAITHYLQQNKPVRILYAGCGPYATLLTPFTSLYNPDQIQFTFLEISEFSYQKVQKLYTDWCLNAYLENLLLCDATDPNLNLCNSFDIILSETMQVGLKNECQVPITRNLVRFLNKNGTFIPEQIKLDVYLTGKPKDELVPNSAEIQFLGTAFDLDCHQLPEKNTITTLTIPESNLEYLKLYTHIQLFGSEYIKPFESGLTLPLILDRPLRKANRTARFQYMEDELPYLHFEYEPIQNL